MNFPRPRHVSEAEHAEWLLWTGLDGHPYAVSRSCPPELWCRRLAKGQWQFVVRSLCGDCPVSEQTWRELAGEMESETNQRKGRK